MITCRQCKTNSVKKKKASQTDLVKGRLQFLKTYFFFMVPNAC